jgi:hypothetical protein
MRISIRLHKLAEVTALMILAALLIQPAEAQTGCESPGDGAVNPQKAAVKRTDDNYTVTWAAPTELADASCTPIASDPEFALTSFEVYISLDAPVADLPPVATVPASQTSLTGSIAGVTGVRPGADIYFAVAACNQFGCSSLSNQEWVKIGGPPVKPQSAVQ